MWKHRKNKLEIIGNGYLYDMGEKDRKYRSIEWVMMIL